MAPSVLESVMDPGRSHDLGISHVGAAASSTEKSVEHKLDEALKTHLSRHFTEKQTEAQKGEGLPCDTAGQPGAQVLTFLIHGLSQSLQPL